MMCDDVRVVNGDNLRSSFALIANVCKYIVALCKEIVITLLFWLPFQYDMSLTVLTCTQVTRLIRTTVFLW